MDGWQVAILFGLLFKHELKTQNFVLVLDFISVALASGLSQLCQNISHILVAEFKKQKHELRERMEKRMPIGTKRSENRSDRVYFVK